MLQPQVKVKVQQMLDDSSLGNLAKWKKISAYLLEEKVMFQQQLTADELIIHPQNRGGMGVQVYNMHSKGKRILECGCDISLLNGSTCVEMHPNQSKKQAQCQVTAKLHQNHPDFIAPVSGKERFLSLSASHVSQFFKAMVLGCKSPEEDLVDPKSGRMSVASHAHDQEFYKAATQGWTWTVVPWYVEETCINHIFLQKRTDAI